MWGGASREEELAAEPAADEGRDDHAQPHAHQGGAGPALRAAGDEVELYPEDVLRGLRQLAAGGDPARHRPECAASTPGVHNPCRSPEPVPAPAHTPPASTASVAICQLRNFPCPRDSTLSSPPVAFSAPTRAFSASPMPAMMTAAPAMIRTHDVGRRPRPWAGPC